MGSSKRSSEAAAVLKGRESRHRDILSLNASHPVLAAVHANVAGADKHPAYVHALIHAFKNRLKTTCPVRIFNRDNADGPYHVLAYRNIHPESLKQWAAAIEDDIPAGRLIDIDVFSGGRALKRPVPRPCMICGRPVFDCIRTSRHATETVIRHQEKIAHGFLRDVLIEHMENSIRDELNLSPKFGLVTPSSKGSHPDMDAGLMMTSARAFLDELAEMFFCSLANDDVKDVFTRCRAIGLRAESKMLAASGGVNCYKGLIFNLGLVLAALAQTLREGKAFKTIFGKAAAIAAPLDDDFSKGTDSFGKIAHRRHGMKGARGEAMRGFPGVRHVLTKFSLGDQASRLAALRWLIVHSEDTVLLKRASSYDNYHLIKERFRQLNLDDPTEVEAWDRYCVSHRLSFGGSADLLVLAFFLRRMQGILF